MRVKTATLLVVHIGILLSCTFFNSYTLRILKVDFYRSDLLITSYRNFSILSLALLFLSYKLGKRKWNLTLICILNLVLFIGIFEITYHINYRDVNKQHLEWVKNFYKKRPYSKQVIQNLLKLNENINNMRNLKYVQRPNTDVTIIEPPRYGTMRVHTNNLGFRQLGDIDKKSLKDADLNIALIGDSVTFGWGANTDETIQANLEQMLKARFPNRIVHVFNLGVGGYGLLEAFASLDYYDYKNLKLDYVIYNLCENDQSVELRFEHPITGCHILYHHSVFFPRYLNIIYNGGVIGYLINYTEYWAKKLEQNNIKLIINLLPYMSLHMQKYKIVSPIQTRRRLASRLKELFNNSVVDYHRAFEKHEPVEELFLKIVEDLEYEVHFSAKGNRIIAEELTNEIVRLQTQ